MREYNLVRDFLRLRAQEQRRWPLPNNRYFWTIDALHALVPATETEWQRVQGIVHRYIERTSGKSPLR